VTSRYGGCGGRFTGRGGAWYPGGARGVGCLTGGGSEVTVHGELHVEDEVAGADGCSVAQDDDFSCEQRHGVVAELRCSWTTATTVAGAVGNVRSSGRGERQGE
jgi:hypothetical protein